MDVLVTYDVATLDREGERRLAKVAAICERFGVRTQYSVFECRLDDINLEKLISELLEVIEPLEDSIHLYRFDRPIPRARITLGRAKSTILGQPWIVGPSRTSDAP